MTATWGVKSERDRAIADYSEAIRLNPKDAVAFNNRGNLWKDKRDLDRAFADYNEAIRLNPKYSMAYNNRGLAWNAKRDLDRAISDYDEAIRLDPKYAPAYNNRGIAWKDMGQLDRAISDYDVAIRLDPKNALARSNRGSSWRTKRDFDRAITDYNEAIRLDPNYLAAITGRGLAYESKGERDRARANFEMALALPPKYDSGKWAQDTARTRLALLPPAKTPSVVAPGPSPAISTDRIALVIGNGAYVNAPHLPNPPNDARAIGRALRGIGFTVIDGTDLDHNGMERTIVDFLRKASLARIALVFYAGHGVQIDGKNYLVPIDAKSMMRSTVTFELIDVDRILASLDDEARANIIILDACRDNPLETRLATRSAARGAGLAGYSTVASGMLIAYAMAPGMTAADGTGQNSPFTTALVKHIGTPGLEINQLLNRVRKDVVDATSRQQIPWTNSSLLGDVVLTDGKPSAAAHP